MKLYKTKSRTIAERFAEFSSSADSASKVRTRLKKIGHEDVSTEEVEVDPTRSGLIKFLNNLMAEPGWVVQPVAASLEG